MVISDAERAWAALLRVHALLVPEFDREMYAASALPLTWYDVLLELHWSGEPLRMTDLGERVVLSRTRVSRIVDELVSAGLVARQTNPEDGRSSFVELTDQGRAKFRQAAKVYQGSIRRRIAEAVDAAKLTEVAETLDRILASNEEAPRGTRVTRRPDVS